MLTDKTNLSSSDYDSNSSTLAIPFPLRMCTLVHKGTGMSEPCDKSKQKIKLVDQLCI